MAVVNNSDISLILLLDDYTLEHIFSYLGVSDQFGIAKVNERFGDIIRHTWRKRLLHVNIDFNDWDSHKELVELLEFVQPNVEHLKLNHMPTIFLHMISNYRFPKVHNLEFNASHKQELSAFWCIEDFAPRQYFNDENITTIVQMFPNIKRLKFRSYNMTDKQLSRFESLERLELTDCSGLGEEGLKRIFAKNQLKELDIMDNYRCSCAKVSLDVYCPTLEYIKLNAYHLDLPDAVQKIISIPYLLKLSVLLWRDQRRNLEKFVQKRIRKIVRLRFSGPLYEMQRCLELISDIPELEELVLQNCFGSRPISNEDVLLHSMSKKLHHLRVLHVSRCKIRNKWSILHFIENCPNLTLLDISYTKMNHRFIGAVVTKLKQQGARTQPLEIWTRSTRISMQHLERFPIRYSHKMLTLNSTSSLKRYRSSVLKLSFGDFSSSSPSFPESPTGA